MLEKAIAVNMSPVDMSPVFFFKRDCLPILNSSVSDIDFFTGSPGDFF